MLFVASAALLSALLIVGSRADKLVLPVSSPALSGFAIVTLQNASTAFEFDFPTTGQGVVWSIHQSAVRYGPRLLEDCAKVAAAPALSGFKPMAVGGSRTITNLSSSDVLGHAIVFTKGDKMVACTNILPSDPESAQQRLLMARFRNERFVGTVHVLSLDDRVRLLPDLNSRNNESFKVGWALAAKWWNNADESASLTRCQEREQQWSPQSSRDSFIGIDAWRSVSIGTGGASFGLNNSLLMLFSIDKNGQKALIDCADLRAVNEQVAAAADGIIFAQPSPFHPVVSESAPPTAKIVNTCEDNDGVVPSALKSPMNDFSLYPTLTLFGTSTLLLKSVRQGDKCWLLRGMNGAAAVAEFFYPIVGSAIIADIDDGTSVVLAQLRHAFDSKDTRARWTLLPGRIGSYLTDLMCTAAPVVPECVDEPRRCPLFGRLDRLLGTPVVVAYNESTPLWFRATTDAFDANLVAGNSLQLDIGWTKACANLTLLRSGTRMAIASLQRHSPMRAPTVGQVRLDERPSDRESTIDLLANLEGEFNVSVHERPIDLTITAGPPCGQRTVGAQWTVGDDLLAQLRGRDLSIDQIQTVPGTLFSEKGIAFLGRTIVLSGKKELVCGTVLPAGDEGQQTKIAAAEFSGSITGFVKLMQVDEQSSTPTWPTEVVYELTKNGTPSREIEALEWTIVEVTENDNGSLPSCLIGTAFNPFQAQSKMNLNEICRENARLCPVGETGLRSGNLELNGRHATVVHNVPLDGPSTVIGRILRIKSTLYKDVVACAVIQDWKKLELDWMVVANRSRQEIQAELVERLGFQPYQIAVSYVRQFNGGGCATYAISITARADQLETVAAQYNRPEKRFNDDEPLICPPIPAPSDSDDSFIPPVAKGTFSSVSASILIIAILSLVPLIVTQNC
uniref:Uncharacterized protein n=1 Tax=Plectus sambesii TaxID=2011161 RepID=A0A914V0C0_9BILA